MRNLSPSLLTEEEKNLPKNPEQLMISLENWLKVFNEQIQKLIESQDLDPASIKLINCGDASISRLIYALNIVESITRKHIEAVFTGNNLYSIDDQGEFLTIQVLTELNSIYAEYREQKYFQAYQETATKQSLPKRIFQKITQTIKPQEKSGEEIFLKNILELLESIISLFVNDEKQEALETKKADLEAKNNQNLDDAFVAKTYEDLKSFFTASTKNLNLPSTVEPINKTGQVIDFTMIKTIDNIMKIEDPASFINLYKNFLIQQKVKLEDAMSSTKIPEDLLMSADIFLKTLAIQIDALDQKTQNPQEIKPYMQKLKNSMASIVNYIESLINSIHSL